MRCCDSRWRKKWRHGRVEAAEFQGGGAAELQGWRRRSRGVPEGQRLEDQQRQKRWSTSRGRRRQRSATATEPSAVEHECTNEHSPHRHDSDGVMEREEWPSGGGVRQQTGARDTATLKNEDQRSEVESMVEGKRRKSMRE
ncbi:hypothetical protein PIB30_030153 [Stylosanthes scabra]|uniref:Uncharacterized protein n=1 Tax=Stylosanthes scabra TaxID=79078 RepID=A0ABU6QB63_9FABA|nr:hypothetical protein [Stylosanthes scabra]